MQMQVICPTVFFAARLVGCIRSSPRHRRSSRLCGLCLTWNVGVQKNPGRGRGELLKLAMADGWQEFDHV